MIIITLREFIDKETNVYNKTGRCIELDDSRANELISKGFAKAVKKGQKKTKSK